MIELLGKVLLRIGVLGCLVCNFSVSLAESRDLHVNPFVHIAKVIAKGSISYQCKQVRFDVGEPAMEIYNSFIKDYDREYKKNGKKHLAVAKLMQKRAHDDVDKLNALKMKLSNVDIVKMNDEFISYLQKYIEYASERIACVEKQALEKDERKGLQFCRQGFALQNKEVYEAKYGYENAVSMLFSNGVKTYAINPRTVAYLRKGNTYNRVMHLFRMPGYFLEPMEETDMENIVPYFLKFSPRMVALNSVQMAGDITLLGGKIFVDMNKMEIKKKRIHQPVIWHDYDKLVYVDFVDGKAENWKFIRVNNGFLNSK